MDIEEYKRTYLELYDHRPSEKRIESFCRLYGIEQKNYWRLMKVSGGKDRWMDKEG